MLAFDNTLLPFTNRSRGIYDPFAHENFLTHLYKKNPSYPIGMYALGHDKVGIRPLAYDDIWRAIQLWDNVPLSQNTHRVKTNTGNNILLLN